MPEEGEEPKKYETEEYELVPVTPLRKIEKRIEDIEKGGPGQKALADLIEALRANQSIFQEVIRLNTEMIKRVSDLVSSVSTLGTQVSELVARGKVPEEHVEHSTAEKKIEERLDKLEKKVNTLLVAMMPRMRRQAPAQPAYGPPPPPAPPV